MSAMTECTVANPPFDVLCPTCLAPGRALLPLRDATIGYRSLMSGLQTYEQIMDFAMTARVCWECLSFLNKIVRFQRQVFDANSLLISLESLNGNGTTLPSFSSLSAATNIGCNYEISHKYLEGEEMWDIPAIPETNLPELNAQYDSITASSTDIITVKGNKPNNKKTAKRTYLKKRSWPGKKILFTGENVNVKIVSVAMSEAEFLKYREEDRKSEEYVNAPHKCELCIKGFAYVSMLEKHKANYHSESIGEHVCAVCGARSAKPEALRRHRRAHYRLYVCAACGFPHRRLASVLRHHHAAHEPGRTYPCEHCSEVFASSRKMRYHRETTHRSAYQCKYCDKVLCNSQSLKCHLLIHTGMPTLECSLCHKACRGETGLYSHMRTAHSSDGAEEAYCKECRIQFKNKNIYRSHLKRSPKHNSPAQMKFSCDQCKKRFISEAMLNQHHRKYHLDYTCHICQKRLKNWFSLDTHVKFVHEGRQLPRKHVCEVCGKAFKTKTMLKHHQYIHTGERPHACDICSATFAQKSTLQTHRRLIHLKLGKNARALKSQGDAGAQY